MNKGVANNAAAAGQGGFSSLITTFSFALTRLVPLLHCTYTQCLKLFLGDLLCYIPYIYNLKGPNNPLLPIQKHFHEFQTAEQHQKMSE